MDMPKQRTFCAAIRQAILDAPVSRYALSKRLGVTQATLSGLVTGKHWVGEELLNGLARELGLRLVVDARRQPRNARK